MPATPKKIKFEDIREGDKVRVVDVRDVVVVENRGFEIVIEGGGIYLPESGRHATGRNFQLLDRLHEPLPTKRGSVVEVDGERFVLVYNTYAPTDLWVSSATGTQLDPPRLQLRVDAADGFKVIA